MGKSPEDFKIQINKINNDYKVSLKKLLDIIYKNNIFIDQLEIEILTSIRKPDIKKIKDNLAQINDLHDKEEDKESIGELMAYSEEGYAKGGAVHHPTDVTPPDLWKGKRKKDEEDKYCPSKDEEYAQGGEAKNWIQGAVKKPGALRAVAAKEGMIKGDEKLSSKDLNRLAAQARKKDNKLLAKRVSLAKTFAKMRKK